MVKRLIPLLILMVMGAGQDLAMPPRVADPAQTSEQTLVKKYIAPEGAYGCSRRL